MSIPVCATGTWLSWRLFIALTRLAPPSAGRAGSAHHSHAVAGGRSPPYTVSARQLVLQALQKIIQVFVARRCNLSLFLLSADLLKIDRRGFGRGGGRRLGGGPGGRLLFGSLGYFFFGHG